MVSPFPAIQYYRDRVTKLRGLASSEKDEKKRASLMELSDSYQRLAETLSDVTSSRTKQSNEHARGNGLPGKSPKFPGKIC